jgi:ABC-type phosphate/phosphonate transport system substrate-binding protein
MWAISVIPPLPLIVKSTLSQELQKQLSPILLVELGLKLFFFENK